MRLIGSVRMLWLVALALPACSKKAPTYYRDVAPIFARHCNECHQTGGVAERRVFDQYEKARTYASALKLSVQTRSMPPWGADNTGLCGSWQGARWLRTEEIDTVVKWADSGAPAGDAAEVPRVPVIEKPFRRDAAVDTGGAYRPGLGEGGNRCFVADPKLDGDRLLTAIRVASTDPRGVAQVTLFALDTPEADRAALALDAAEPGLGYHCYGQARVDGARLVASWTWPAPVLRLPDGVGVRLRAGRALVIQIHYDIMLPGDTFNATTTVELELAGLGGRTREAVVVPVRAEGSLAPGQRWVAVEAQTTLPHGGQLVGIAPRMHIRGQTLQLASGATCLGTFDHWHTKSQQLFVAAQPTTLPDGAPVHIQCAYNTLGREKPVVFGDDIDDEECLANLYITDR